MEQTGKVWTGESGERKDPRLVWLFALLVLAEQTKSTLLDAKRICIQQIGFRAR